MRRLIHISDLHFGRADRAVTEALLAEVNALSPDLVVVSGDLTQRARAWQFRDAADFLKKLPCRFLSVPGNHDIPLYHLPLRLAQPLANYRRYIEEDVEPVFQDEEILVAGVNTATRWRWTEGRLRRAQIQKIRGLLRAEASVAVKILFMHHPPARGLRSIRKILDSRPDLILSGHLHKGSMMIHDAGSILVAAGTAVSTRLRGEGNSFNVVDVSAGRNPDTSAVERRIRIHARHWVGAGFTPGSDWSFASSGDGWSRLDKA